MLPDPVPTRMHWPRFADLRVNSMSYRPYGRQANVKIGGNIRDEPANIGAHPPRPCVLLTAAGAVHLNGTTICSAVMVWMLRGCPSH